MTDIELKPCPFCGGEAAINLEFHGSSSAAVECLGCLSEGPLASTPSKTGNENAAEAIAAWNTRPAPTGGEADLRAAAKAVIHRWDTPAWKDAEPTAHVIGRLRSALAPSTSAQVEGGWVLVPREPTEAMLEIGRRVDWETLTIGTGATRDKPLDPNYIQRAVWSAMLAAAPSPPTGGLETTQAAFDAGMVEEIIDTIKAHPSGRFSERQKVELMLELSPAYPAGGVETGEPTLWTSYDGRLIRPLPVPPPAAGPTPDQVKAALRSLKMTDDGGDAVAMIVWNSALDDAERYVLALFTPKPEGGGSYQHGFDAGYVQGAFDEANGGAIISGGEQPGAGAGATAALATAGPSPDAEARPARWQTLDRGGLIAMARKWARDAMYRHDHNRHLAQSQRDADFYRADALNEFAALIEAGEFDAVRAAPRAPAPDTPDTTPGESAATTPARAPGGHKNPSSNPPGEG